MYLFYPVKGQPGITDSDCVQLNLIITIYVPNPICRYISVAGITLIPVKAITRFCEVAVRKVCCESCGKEYPLNETVSAFAKTYCFACADIQLKEMPPEAITNEAVFRQVDDTVCARCGTDNGQSQLDRLCEIPVCPACAERMRQWPFPLWIKAACILIVAGVIASTVLNWRFVVARYTMPKAFKAAFQEQNWEKAALLFDQAATAVPETQEMRSLHKYCLGVISYRKEQYDEALKYLLESKPLLPVELKVDSFIQETRIGKAFNDKNYEQFLQLALELEKSNPTSHFAIAQVASAYACIYAIKGQAENKEKAMDYLGKAEKQTDDLSRKDFEEYRDRILHRLSTREIITREQYYQRIGKPLPGDKL